MERILIVEDDPVCQKVLKFYLEREGYETETAQCGEEALTLCSSTNYFMIFMDIGLPDIAGTEVTKNLRIMEKKEAGQRLTRIIGLTAHGEYIKQQCIEAGMDDFVSKPIELYKVKELINNNKCL